MAWWDSGFGCFFFFPPPRQEYFIDSDVFSQMALNGSLGSLFCRISCKSLPVTSLGTTKCLYSVNLSLFVSWNTSLRRYFALSSIWLPRSMYFVQEGQISAWSFPLLTSFQNYELIPNNLQRWTVSFEFVFLVLVSFNIITNL